MKKINITEFGNPILRARAKIVSKDAITNSEIKDLIAQLQKVLKQTDGIGIAAPQIGVSKKVIVLETRPTPTRPTLATRGPVIAINPRIIWRSKKKVSDWEGCLSLPGVRGKVPRAYSVEVEYLDEKGLRCKVKEKGLWARLFQHEIDHLEGTLFTDRMTEMKTLITKNELERLIVVK